MNVWKLEGENWIKFLCIPKLSSMPGTISSCWLNGGAGDLGCQHQDSVGNEHRWCPGHRTFGFLLWKTIVLSWSLLQVSDGGVAFSQASPGPRPGSLTGYPWVERAESQPGLPQHSVANIHVHAAPFPTRVPWVQHRHREQLTAGRFSG